MASLTAHMSDLICNFDMLLVSVKGCSAPKSVRFNPPLCRQQLVQARDYLLLLADRLNDAADLAEEL